MNYVYYVCFVAAVSCAYAMQYEEVPLSNLNDTRQREVERFLKDTLSVHDLVLDRGLRDDVVLDTGNKIKLSPALMSHIKNHGVTPSVKLALAKAVCREEVKDLPFSWYTRNRPRTFDAYQQTVAAASTGLALAGLLAVWGCAAASAATDDPEMKNNYDIGVIVAAYSTLAVLIGGCVSTLLNLNGITLHFSHAGKIKDAATFAACQKVTT